MRDRLHIDVETYSTYDIKKVGAYKYVESDEFEILMIAYAFNDDPVEIIDLAAGEEMPEDFVEALDDPEVVKYAHNATFERLCFREYGYDIPADQWNCSMVKAAYCGLPLNLGILSKALKLGEKAKKSTGKALIKYFCGPCRPTKVNGQRTRNYYHHDAEKWEAFKTYCMFDVEAEREITKILSPYPVPKLERILYVIDQKINDYGVVLDDTLARNAVLIDDTRKQEITEQLKDLTGLENPNSQVQLCNWLSDRLERRIKSIAKDKVAELLESVTDKTVRAVLKGRVKLSKTSTTKYKTMLVYQSELDGRGRGFLQFYGANRTGRWAGRGVQVHNLPKNKIDGKELDLARDVIRNEDYDTVRLMYGDIAKLLSWLIRTAFIAPRNYTFAVADFSAIEARVTAWLANETWRLDVFNGHGKIYEESASRMFDIPLDQITKGSEERAKGKVAELALGFGGGVHALKTMGGEDMGLSESDMSEIVRKWREASPNIADLWRTAEFTAKKAMRTKTQVWMPNGLVSYSYDGKVLQCHLPSGRSLFYYSARFTLNKWGKPEIKYQGNDPKTSKWGWASTYGGKLVENMVQAIARDLLSVTIYRLDKAGYKIPMHVHDEVLCEVREDEAEGKLQSILDIMGKPVKWAKGLPLEGDGYITTYYKKD